MKNLNNNNNETKKVINQSKKQINNLDLLNLDFEKMDSNNFDLLLSQTLEKAKKEKIVKGTKGKSSMYKIEVNTKIRRKLRNERNSLLNEIILNAKNPKIQIEAFEKFYKETYVLNDYSLSSLANENSDKNSLSFVKIALEVIKRFKAKK